MQKEQLIAKFQELYGEGGEIRTYFAPGRVNLIGEHTDYNGGHVFPCALTMGTWAVVRNREDRKLGFFSLNFEKLGIIETSLDELIPSKNAGWTNYPKGVMWAFEKRGYELTHGMDILIYGNIPNGSGLSSSASLEVLTGLMLKDTFGFEEDEIIYTSAKKGIGIKELVETIIKKVPAPKGDKKEKLQALIFDSCYDPYRGIMTSIRVINGTLKIGDKIEMMSTGVSYDVVELYVHTPNEKKVNELVAGEVGIIYASMKSISDVKVGDTITHTDNPANERLIGYKPMKPMVFCGLYPIETSRYPDLRDALEKLKLNDASLEFEPETSKALGFGFRCGFLGLLHMEIIEERIEREFGIELIATSPSVIYDIELTDGSNIKIDSPVKMPEKVKIKDIKEPYIRTNIFVPSEYIGPIMELCQDKRGNYVSMEYLDQTRVNIHYEIPLSEIVYDFFDKLKSATKGYASFDYDLIGYKSSQLTKMDILLNGEIIDALSVIVHKDFAYKRGKAIVENLKKLIPRQQFEVPIQACIGNKAIARETVKAVRKDVLAKCYGGDVSRKRKLLEKQKEGKKRMKTVGSVEIPQEAFMSVLSMDGE